MKEDIEELKRRMQGAIETLKKEFTGLRTGRASIHLLEPVMVEAYGSRVPLQQIGTVSAPEPRMLTVQVWDKGMVKAVEKAIRESGLGVNPTAEGQNVRVILPELTEERRLELVKVAAKYGEQARVSVRNIRRDGMEAVKAAQKASKISEDEMHKQVDIIQKATDDFIKKIDEDLRVKEKEIKQI